MMEYSIAHTWDSIPVNHNPVTIHLQPGDGGLLMEVRGPFFNDPPAPAGPPGEPFDKLWDYEVAEAFFLNSTTEKYLEVEVCPHGQHLILLLHGRGNAWKRGLSLKYEASIEGNEWHGKALLPWRYFPPGVNKMNLYAIHGSDPRRTYEALYPVPREDLKPGQGPNFHLLEYFQNFNLKDIMGNDFLQPDSDLWSTCC
ncbi:UPF0462 protein C4orf33 homolog isoform X1 [Erpetoichthys calabaricus]|uniref:Chromosome 4 open reading frame 33 n=2 Tax=Erpetoichthys calabaricus TaxID=27687 RepID=A0A8C4XHA4_ERPCA|nr:UPF0462 protein C4orf33 homolog isoform X1 [Erpetoichthys calabaricus]